jgi:hypothetical protein
VSVAVRALDLLIVQSFFEREKKEKMDSGSNDHEGIWETDFKIDYKDLNFEGEVAEGAFGKIYKGDYFGTPVAIKKYTSPLCCWP